MTFLDDAQFKIAIYRVNKRLGPDVQALTVVGTPIAWLFALPMKGVSNGFSVTGGLFNYTAEVSFPASGHLATVEFIFEGLDAFDYLKATVRIDGTLPKLSKSKRQVWAKKYPPVWVISISHIFFSQQK